MGGGAAWAALWNRVVRFQNAKPDHQGERTMVCEGRALQRARFRSGPVALSIGLAASARRKTAIDVGRRNPYLASPSCVGGILRRTVRGHLYADSGRGACAR